jgi:hypothetical protein
LLRSHAEILRALHRLGVDLDPDHGPRTTNIGPNPDRRRDSRRAADLAGTTPNGDALSIAVIDAQQPTMLAFLTTGCSTCANFWDAFADEARLRVPGDARLVVVTKGEDAESPARLRKFAPAGVPVVMSSAAWDDYDVPVAPYFAYVDGESGTVVGEGAANTWDHVVSMCEQAIADAGLTPRRRARRRRGFDGRAREARADEVLRAAGIEPGHPSLHPRDIADLESRAQE